MIYLILKIFNFVKSTQFMSFIQKQHTMLNPIPL